MQQRVHYIPLNRLTEPFANPVPITWGVQTPLGLLFIYEGVSPVRFLKPLHSPHILFR